MASSTLLQKLDGGSDFGASTSNRRQVEIFVASAAITKGDVVMFDDTKTGADRVLYVKQATTVVTGNGLAAGVALEAAAAAGDSVRVVIAGYAEDVKCAAAVAAGTVLNAAGAVVGQVEPAAAADLATFGVAVEAVAGSTVDMIVYKQF
jgi:hypothetical protein